MNHNTPGLPVHHQLLESTQTHVHSVRDAIQPSHPLSSPSPPALNLSQHQGLFKPGYFVYKSMFELSCIFPWPHSLVLIKLCSLSGPVNVLPCSWPLTQDAINSGIFALMAHIQYFKLVMGSLERITNLFWRSLWSCLLQNCLHVEKWPKHPVGPIQSSGTLILRRNFCNFLTELSVFISAQWRALHMIISSIKGRWYWKWWLFIHPCTHSTDTYWRSQKARLWELSITKMSKTQTLPLPGRQKSRQIIAISVKSTVMGVYIRHNGGPQERVIIRGTWLSFPKQSYFLLFPDFLWYPSDKCAIAKNHTSNRFLKYQNITLRPGK